MIKISNETILTAEDIDLILMLIAQANFPVKEIERLYKLIIKLQDAKLEKSNSQRK